MTSSTHLLGASCHSVSSVQGPRALHNWDHSALACIVARVIRSLPFRARGLFTSGTIRHLPTLSTFVSFGLFRSGPEGSSHLGPFGTCLHRSSCHSVSSAQGPRALHIWDHSAPAYPAPSCHSVSFVRGPEAPHIKGPFGTCLHHARVRLVAAARTRRLSATGNPSARLHHGRCGSRQLEPESSSRRDRRRQLTNLSDARVTPSEDVAPPC
jgi:hypothetical protein